MNTTPQNFQRQPALFFSHGSPMIALEPGAAGLFMRQFGQRLRAQHGVPRAILAVSAHTLARSLTLLAAPRHAAVYDFGNFDQRLNQLRYDAPGAPALAPRVQQLLGAAGLPCDVVADGGLDHGIWTVLRYLFPAADVPVLPLAWRPEQAAHPQFQLGQALAPLLDEGVLLLATGSMTHNLRRVFSQGMNAPVDQPEAPESARFREWMWQKSQALDWPALWAARQLAPHAVDMHPSDEHLLPWFVAAGAGGLAGPAVRLHDSVTYGWLGMDAYAFGPLAAGLADGLTVPATDAA